MIMTILSNTIIAVMTLLELHVFLIISGGWVVD